jgi:hypothetical protein
MRRRSWTLFISALLATSFLFTGSVANVFAAGITCTSSSPGYKSIYKNVGFVPPPRPNWHAQGQLWVRFCTDGVGFSQKWRSLGTVTSTSGGVTAPQQVSSQMLHSQFGDDCGIWDEYGPVTLFNIATVQYSNSVWHWQPAVRCGPSPQYNTYPDANGTITQTNVFVWSWHVNWP